MIRYVIKYSNGYYVGTNNRYNGYSQDEYNMNIKYSKKYKSLNSLVRGRLFKQINFRDNFLDFVDNIEYNIINERSIKIHKILNRELSDTIIWDYFGYMIEILEIVDNKILDVIPLKPVDFFIYFYEKRNFMKR